MGSEEKPGTLWPSGRGGTEARSPDFHSGPPCPLPCAPLFIYTDFTLDTIYIFILGCHYAPKTTQTAGVQQTVKIILITASYRYISNTIKTTPHCFCCETKGVDEEAPSSFGLRLVDASAVLLWSPVILLPPSLGVPRKRAMAALWLPGAAVFLHCCSRQADTRPQHYAFDGPSTSHPSDKEHAESCTDRRRY